MKNKKAIFTLSLTLVLCLTQTLMADSIWAKRDKKKQKLYADDKAHQIGDILTINIEEDSTIDNKSKRKLEKTTKRSAEFDGKVGIDHIIADIPSVRLGAGTEYSNTLDGKADYKDERSYEDSITVTVEDIMPNGNLVVVGVRHRSISDDIQIIEVSGIVRPSDISLNNTISSTKVANFHLITKNQGVSAPFTKPNWLARIFNAIWPF